ncbi:hydrogenase maturation protease [Actinoplanes sp. GCM10030250]|uniref:hydrogenase maturation protease n=1 Tax=Actinoplanes sp. GCM10030250 TaxID=3273376 RepID=UPI003610E1C5
MNVLVAGIGNLFLGDDGFGPEVVRRLAAEPARPGVRVSDYGIRGMHLAYDLLDGYDLLILVDALPSAGTPGEVVVLGVGPDDVGPAEFDPHGMNPVAVLGGLSRLGGTLPPTVVVGCRVAAVTEGIGLSPSVAAAVPAAVDAVRTVLTRCPADSGEPRMTTDSGRS